MTSTIETILLLLVVLVVVAVVARVFRDNMSGFICRGIEISQM